jgi:hypothetical protein
LFPFHNDTGSYWNAASVRFTTSLGYTYEELTLPDINSIRASINDQYGPTPVVVSSRSKRSIFPERTLNLHAEYCDYVMNIKVDPRDVNSNFVVYAFMGPYSDDPSDWDKDAALVGTDTVFSVSFAPGDSVSTLTSGIIPLTRRLQQMWVEGDLSTLDEAVVVPYLSNSLHWRVLKVLYPQHPSDIWTYVSKLKLFGRRTRLKYPWRRFRASRFQL